MSTGLVENGRPARGLTLIFTAADVRACNGCYVGPPLVCCGMRLSGFGREDRLQSQVYGSGVNVCLLGLAFLKVRPSWMDTKNGFLYTIRSRRQQNECGDYKTDANTRSKASTKTIATGPKRSRFIRDAAK